MITPEKQNKIDALFQLWQDHPGAGGQVLITQKGETVFEKCYGYADIENKIPMTQESVFNVASVTKQITAMCILILHDRGALHIDDEVKKYLPEMMNYPEKITISNLLHHTSGLREAYDLWRMHKKAAGEAITFPKMFHLFAQQRSLNFAPGTDFSYCNSGYMMMTEIVKRVSGKPFPEFAQENIFEPLGMTQTHFVEGPGVIVPNSACSYHDDGWEYTQCISNSYVYGSGGMRSTCRDMTKFMPQYVNPTLVSKQTMEQVNLHIPPLADGTVTNYACGVRIDQLLGHKYFHHGGVTGGFRAVTAIYPDDDLVIAAYTNTYNIPIEVAGRDIARIILDLPERKKKDLAEYTTDTVDISQIPGYYVRKSGGGDFSSDCYDVKLKDGEAYVKFNGKYTRLTPIGGNLYKMGRRNITFAFGDQPAINREESVVPLKKLTNEICSAEADALVGRYYNEEVDGEIIVSISDGQLRISQNEEVPQTLYVLNEDLFCCGSFATPHNYQVWRDESGAIKGLVLTLPQVRRIVYNKCS